MTKESAHLTFTFKKEKFKMNNAPQLCTVGDIHKPIIYDAIFT
jgi:hypothetical protein